MADLAAQPLFVRLLTNNRSVLNTSGTSTYSHRVSLLHPHGLPSLDSNAHHTARPMPPLRARRPGISFHPDRPTHAPTLPKWVSLEPDSASDTTDDAVGEIPSGGSRETFERSGGEPVEMADQETESDKSSERVAAESSPDSVMDELRRALPATVASQWLEKAPSSALPTAPEELPSRSPPGLSRCGSTLLGSGPLVDASAHRSSASS